MPTETQQVRVKPSLTKVLATLGPASEDVKTLGKMVEAGARLFRLNFSHGDFGSHRMRLDVVRSVSASMGVPLAVVGDLQGPKIRVGVMPEGGIEVVPGQEVVISGTAGEMLVRDEGRASTPVLPTTYGAMVREVQAGQRVLINDGAVRMLAVESSKDELRCVVKVGGRITTRKGINLPDSVLSVPALSERDWECARWGVEHDLDFLALSFVRTGNDVAELNRRLAELGAGRGTPGGGQRHADAGDREDRDAAGGGEHR